MHRNSCCYLEVIEVYLQRVKLTSLVILCSILLLRHILSLSFIYLYSNAFQGFFMPSISMDSYTLSFPCAILYDYVLWGLFEKNSYLFWKFLSKTSVPMAFAVWLLTLFFVSLLREFIFFILFIHSSYYIY